MSHKMDFRHMCHRARYHRLSIISTILKKKTTKKKGDSRRNERDSVRRVHYKSVPWEAVYPARLRLTRGGILSQILSLVKDVSSIA